MRVRLVLAMATLVGFGAVPASAMAGNPGIGTGGSFPNFVFTNNEPTVDVGSTVTITNTQVGTGHTLVWEDNGAPGVPTPDATMWSRTRTFTAPGEYRFRCMIHSTSFTSGMVGHVTVVAATASGTPAPTSPAPAPAQPTSGTPTPAADRTAPKLRRVRTATTRRAVTVRLRLSERATVTVAVRRGSRTVKTRVFRNRRAGAATLRVPVRLARGRVTVRITARDAAGNTVRTT